MLVQSAVFYFFATTLVIAALAMITVRNPVHAALFLVLVFFTSAAIWLLLEAEFLAIVLVLVYVGAVMVLFLFVVMMLDINIAKIRAGYAKYLPIGVLVSVMMVVEMIVVLNGPAFNLQKPQPKPNDYSNTQELGELLFTEYVYPFEIAGVILLVAIIAAIILTMRKRTDGKRQNPSKQINVNKRDRVRLVSLDKD
ncbi:MAG: NADH-quinone oxidoreductase subunit J [Gammaproteobacteria bacterium]|jgi:NADH-quinone oxidoreductase subunit J|nr:NADH-quinone oxidoreductase subunit J [Gammaproteobacteria bacterium]